MMHRQLRAYVLASFAEILEPDKNGNVTISVTIKNFGQTPASRVVTDANYKFDERDIEKSDDKPSEHIVGAAEPFWSEYQLTPENIASMKAEKTPIQVFGKVTYTDIFKKPHWTTFSFYSTAEDGFEPHKFLVSPTGNSVDED
jgi:hypothetical protein